MNEKLSTARLTRRALLAGAAGTAAVYSVRGQGPSSGAPGGSAAAAQGITPLTDAVPVVAGIPDVHLAATDGWVSIADDARVSASSKTAMSPFWPDPYGPDHGVGKNLYVFGFRNVTGLTDAQVGAERGKAQISAPMLAFDEGKDYRVKLSNLGLVQRPDLVDGHTIHWHGFVNAIPLFDGVPELSISVPIGRSFTYYYRPHDPGTYMYHCHFEDVEHVQMGMTGLLFVRPKQNGTSIANGGRTFTKFAYNCADGSTGYDREFSVFLTEVFVEGHYRDAHIQVTDWTDFQASFWAINGRTYPDTVAGPAPYNATRGFDPLAATAGSRLQYQPNSALVTANAGERVLLRMANLGYQNHAMTVDSLDLTVVAKDASLLRNGSVNQYLVTNQVETGPGESRDVLFTAPAFTGGTGSSGKGYDSYLLYDRDYQYEGYPDAGNANALPVGGMITEIRVFPASGAGSLTPQTIPNA